MLGQFVDCKDAGEKAKSIAVRLLEIIECNERNEISLSTSEFGSLFDELSRVERQTVFRCTHAVREVRQKMIKVAKQITCHPITHRPTLIKRR